MRFTLGSMAGMRRTPLLLSLLCIGVAGSIARAEVTAITPEAASPESVSQESTVVISKTALDKLRADFVRPKDIPYPDDNPYSKEKSDLGKKLYFDPRLSASGTTSCATCHNPSFYWQDALALGTGNEHKKLGRHTPTILNLAWDELFFWDGRAESLEDQALGPIKSPGEMNVPIDMMIAKLDHTPEYLPLFEMAFFSKNPKDAKITPELVAAAIATYERGVVSADAPFDKWIKGDENAIEESAKRGFVLFNTKANCAACHSGWNLSDGSFHDIGLKSEDIGRGKFLTKMPKMQHAFKTVGLRNIAERAPYMHDGSLETLDAVIDHYDHGFVKRDSLADEIKPLNLTPGDKADLISFLKTLSSKDTPVDLPILPK